MIGPVTQYQNEYDKQCRESEIIKAYIEKRETEIITEMMNDDDFYLEALENVRMAPEDMQQELVNEWRKVSAESHYDATMSIVEWYADWNAKTIVARETETKSIFQMKSYLDKRDHELYRDDVQIVRV